MEKKHKEYRSRAGAALGRLFVPASLDRKTTLPGLEEEAATVDRARRDGRKPLLSS